jgi:hypothetical protein
LATFAATIGLLAAFASGASAWEGTFHGADKSGSGSGKVSFEIIAPPGHPIGLIHFSYRGGNCPPISPGSLYIYWGSDALRAATGTSMFENRHLYERFDLRLDFTRHGNQVTTAGEFRGGARCSHEWVLFTATAAATGLP